MMWSSKEAANAFRVILVGTFFAGAVAAVLGMSCSASQPVTEAATCSPKADVWHQVELVRACGEKETDECPAAAEIRAHYLELEAAECSKTQ